MSTVTCRNMERQDLEAVRPLTQQLGYEITSEELAERFDAIRTGPDHLLIVAERDARVAGFLHGFLRPALEKPPEAVVQAMAVDQAVRRAGIGRALLVRAETWARDCGAPSISLYSQIERGDAHAFYTQLGFGPAATSALLRKTL